MAYKSNVQMVIRKEALKEVLKIALEEKGEELHSDLNSLFNQEAVIFAVANRPDLIFFEWEDMKWYDEGLPYHDPAISFLMDTIKVDFPDDFRMCRIGSDMDDIEYHGDLDDIQIWVSRAFSNNFSTIPAPAEIF